MDGDHLHFPPLALSTDGIMSKVEKARRKDISPKASRKDISPKASRKDISPKERIFMTNLHVRLSTEPEYPTRDVCQPV
jgi:hypothetical protein